jgi:predicted dehydrogenase
VSDINERLAEKSAERWRIPYHYKTLSEALTNAYLDIVDICTPPQVHAVQAIEAMKNGISVLIEKPMTITVSDAQAIVDCQRETGVFAGVLHNWLFDEPVLEARAMVAKGDIGEVFNITVEALSRKQDSMVVNEHHWSHKFPGGRLSEMLAHPIYLVRHFLGGDLEVSDVKVSKLSDYPWMKSDELCATFKVGPKMGRTYVSFNSSRDAIYINLYGKKGIIKLDIINSTINILPKMEVSRLNKGFDSLRQASQLVKSAAKNTSKVMLRRWSTGHDNYIKLFAKNLINNCPPPVTVEDGLAVIKTVEDICKKIEEQEKN